MEVNKDNQPRQYQQYKNRWRNSVNQFSKLQEESKLVVFDTKQKKVSTLKLRMRNRLAQIDEQFHPFLLSKKNNQNDKSYKNDQFKDKIASTQHETNILTLGSWDSNIKMEQSLILLNPKYHRSTNELSNLYGIQQIREEIIQELTEYNRSSYEKQMKQHCSKYNDSLKSMFYTIVNHPKKQLYEFCYHCDQIIEDKHRNNRKQKQKHTCKTPIDSILRVQQSLTRIRNIVEQQNDKIFDIFLHNTMQPLIQIDELVSNVNVLKQSLQLDYEPEEAVLRMRLMNLIGKKIGLLIEQNQLQQRLESITKSKSLKMF